MIYVLGLLEERVKQQEDIYGNTNYDDRFMD